MAQKTEQSVEKALEQARNAAFPVAAYFAKKADCSPDDILNDAALIVCRNPSRFLDECPEGSFRRVVRNVGLDYLRRRARRLRREVPLEFSADSLPDRNLTSTGPGTLEQQEVAARVRTAISRRLSPAQSEVTYKLLEGQSLNQIAAESGESPKLVSQINQRASAELRAMPSLRRLFESFSAMLLWIKREPLKATSLTCGVGVLVVAGFATANAIQGDAASDTMDASTWEAQRGAGGGGTAAGADEAADAGARGDVAAADGGARAANASTVTPFEAARGHLEDSSQTLQPNGFDRADSNVRSGSVDAQPEGVLTHHRIDRGTSGTPYLTWTELDGLRHGVSTVFRADGTRQTTTTFALGVRHGPHIEFAEDGIRINRIVTFENGKWVHSSEDDE